MANKEGKTLKMVNFIITAYAIQNDEIRQNRTMKRTN